jgi:glutamyl-tRNA reductase
MKEMISRSSMQRSSRSMNFGRNTMRRVGLVGAGYIADWHAQGLRSVENVELVAVCDRALERAQALAGKFGVAQRIWFARRDAGCGEGSMRCMCWCRRTCILRRRARRLRPA